MMFGVLYKMCSDLVQEYMNHPSVNELLASNEKFDICVFEVFNVDALLVSVNY